MIWPKRRNIIKHKNLLSHFNFWWYWNSKFYHHKSPANQRDIDIEEKDFFWWKKNYKYFIGYLYKDLKVNSLHILLPKTSAYVKSYGGQTKWMYFLTEDIILFNIKLILWEKYNTFWDNVSTDIKKEFDSKPVFNKEFLKTKIKSHVDEVKDSTLEKNLNSWEESQLFRKVWHFKKSLNF